MFVVVVVVVLVRKTTTTTTTTASFFTPKSEKKNQINQSVRMVKEWKSEKKSTLWHPAKQNEKMKNEIVNTDDDDDDKMFFGTKQKNRSII